MRRTGICTTILMVWLGAAFAARADEIQAAKSYVVEPQRFAAAPVIDGHLTEEVWSKAAVMAGFVQYEPKEGQPATEATEVLVGYDPENLYLGLRCHDADPSRLVANVLNRDGDLTYDDMVQVILDTYHDRQNGFLFATNPLGAKIEGLVRGEGEDVILDWDGQWENASARDAQGWTAEMRFPFKMLRFPMGATQTWGINIERFVARKGERSFWKPLLVSYGTHARYKISEFGTLSGLTGVQAGTKYELRPYGLGENKRRGEDQTNWSSTGGLDLRSRLTSDMVVDLTLNMDFAEAEADEQRQNISRFKLFYPEKRRFFLEGADIFYFGERIEPSAVFGDIFDKFSFFYSRRIGLSDDGLEKIPVLGGAKVIGTLNDVSVGFLNLSTGQHSYDRGGAQEFYQPRTNYTVLRLKRSVFRQSSVGLIGLNKQVDGGVDNRGFGADWNLAFGDHLRMMGFAAKTSTAGLNGADRALSADVLWDAEPLRLRALYTEIGENFNPEMGFLSRSGIRKFQGDVLLLLRKGFLGAQKIYINYDLNYIADRHGNVKTRIQKLEFSPAYKNSSGFAIALWENLEVLDTPLTLHTNVTIPPGRYEFRSVFFGAATDYSKPFGATIWFEIGSYYDGSRRHLLLAGLARPWNGFQAGLIFDRHQFDMPEGDFSTNLLTLSMTHAFSQKLSTRVDLKWNKEDNFTVNFLLSWTYRPGSDISLVYNHHGDLTEARPWLSERALIAKVNYRFDF